MGLKNKEKSIWMLSMLVSALFVVAAVRVWSVPSEEVLGYLQAALFLLVALMLLGLIVAALITLVRRFFSRD